MLIVSNIRYFFLYCPVQSVEKTVDHACVLIVRYEIFQRTKIIFKFRIKLWHVRKLHFNASNNFFLENVNQSFHIYQLKSENTSTNVCFELCWLVSNNRHKNVERIINQTSKLSHFVNTWYDRNEQVLNRTYEHVDNLVLLNRSNTKPNLNAICERRWIDSKSTKPHFRRK